MTWVTVCVQIGGSHSTNIRSRPGTPFSPPPTSIRVDSPFIDKMRHPKYQHGFLGVDAEWKNGGEDLEGVRKWENLQMGEDR